MAARFAGGIALVLTGLAALFVSHWTDYERNSVLSMGLRVILVILMFYGFFAFWIGICVAANFRYAAITRDRVGIRFDADGITVQNSVVGRKSGTIPWSNIRKIVRRSKWGFRILLIEPQQVAAASNQMRTFMANGVPLGPVQLDIGRERFVAIVERYRSDYLENKPASSRQLQPSSQPAVVPRPSRFTIHAAPARLFIPLGPLSIPLHGLNLLVLLAGLAPAVAAHRYGDVVPAQARWILAICIAVLILHLCCGFVFLRGRSVTLGRNGIDEITWFGRQIHYSLSGLDTVNVQPTAPAMSMPLSPEIVGITLSYRDGSRHLISGTVMRASDMRELASRLIPLAENRDWQQR
jgi:hypothetical protein